MRVIKPQRLSVLQRVFELRGERFLSLGLAAYLPFEAPDLPLPEIAMWKEIPKQLGKDVALDEGLPKPRGEVLVFGKGFAPGGKAQPAFQVRVEVGPVNKTIYVVGRRRWVRGVPSEPEPLSELLLGWDKAFGGEGYVHNPLGMGFAPIEEQGKQVHHLPQLEDPKHLMKSPGDRPTPMSLGSLDPTWPVRQSKAGTYDNKWLENDFPGFARDLDPEYFMMAPLDQRLPAFFEGEEAITIENLHPTEPRLNSRVTKLIGRGFVMRRTESGEVFEEIGTRLETLVLIPNLRRMVAIFRGVTRVSEDDAADVINLVAAFERRGAPRPKEHYRAILDQRLDKKKGYLLALRDRDLLPDPDPDAPSLPDEKISDMEDLLAREGVMEKHARARAQSELDEARRSALVLGIDPDEKGIPRELPPPDQPPKLDELDEYMEQVEAEVAKLEAEAKAKQDEALNEARKNLAEQGIDLDEAMERAKKDGGGPPKFRAEDHISQMKEMAKIGRDLGAPLEELEAQIEDPAFLAKLRELEDTQLIAYRSFAHHLPPAPLPDEEAQRSLRERVESALAERRSMMGWDLTGADLRDLDFSGANLREALLELADLRGAKLAGADLSGAVLVRAKLDEVRLAGAVLEGANLGEIEARGADFEGARLSKAVLQRGELEGARFCRADLRGADLFEARLPRCDLEGMIADELLFYECNLEGAKLDKASLRKAILFRCQMANASFVEAVLEGAAMVEVRAEGACFTRAHANNLRLVLACELGGADFSEAELSMATMRGVSLGGAKLNGTRAEGSDFSESDLRKAELKGAWLKDARLMRSDLGDAKLEGVNLMEAMLQNAKIHGANFEGSNLFRANLMGAVGDTATSFKDAHVVRTLFSRRRR